MEYIESEIDMKMKGQDRVPTHKVLVKGSKGNEVYMKNVVDLEDDLLESLMKEVMDEHNRRKENVKKHTKE